MSKTHAKLELASNVPAVPFGALIVDGTGKRRFV
jgi:hypothetical protein